MSTHRNLRPPGFVPDIPQALGHPPAYIFPLVTLRRVGHTLQRSDGEFVSGPTTTREVAFVTVEAAASPKVHVASPTDLVQDNMSEIR